MVYLITPAYEEGPVKWVHRMEIRGLPGPEKLLSNADGVEQSLLSVSEGSDE